jgi:DNA-directed RNA polymerase specialized sigma24 family protein
MLMTHKPPEFLPITAECVEQIGIPDLRHRLEPDGEENENTFSQQFSRCREMLYFIAYRILNCAEEAEVAVKNCYCTASRNSLQFESEGAFKSWLVRILIDEATLLRGKESSSTASSAHLPEAR